MKYAPFIAIFLLALSCGGCHSSDPARSQTVDALNALNELPDPTHQAVEAERILTSHGFSVPADVDSWNRLSNASIHASLNARMALNSVATRWGYAYQQSLYEIFAAKADSFSRLQLLQLLVDSNPNEEYVAAEVLKATISLQNASWADHIDLHGNSPFDLLQVFILPKEWIVPDEVDHDDDGIATVAWCRRILTSRDSWRYVVSAKKWTVREIK